MSQKLLAGAGGTVELEKFFPVIQFDQITMQNLVAVSYRVGACRSPKFGSSGAPLPSYRVVPDPVETRPSPRYHTKFGRSRSNSMGIGRVLKYFEVTGDPPTWDGA